MDFTSILSGLLSGGASAPYQMPTFGADGSQSNTQIGGDQNPILGWLSKNGGGLSSAANGAMTGMQQKPIQAPPMQLNMPQAPRPQAVQVPQLNGLLNMPVAPANPMMAR